MTTTAGATPCGTSSSALSGGRRRWLSSSSDDASARSSACSGAELPHRWSTYLRSARDDAGQIDAQRHQLAGYARARGWEVLREHVDTGTSRTGRRALLASLGDVDAVLVWGTDRLARNPAELPEIVEALATSRTVLHVAQDGSDAQLDALGMLGSLGGRG